MENKNFSLRPLCLADADRMLEWMKDEDTIRYLHIGGNNVTKETVTSFIRASSDESSNIHRAIVDENDTYLGTISLKNIVPSDNAEYAIVLHPQARGTGAAAAATKGILAFAFQQLKLKSVYLNVIASNTRAVRFYEKMGLKFEKTTKTIVKGQEYDLFWFVTDGTNANVGSN